jgi:hypothetical protein
MEQRFLSDEDVHKAEIKTIAQSVVASLCSFVAIFHAQIFLVLHNYDIFIQGKALTLAIQKYYILMQ